MIKGYKQTEGLDYFDAYSSVTKINTIRIVLAIDALRNLEVHQMDVNTTFLSGHLDEKCGDPRARSDPVGESEP